MQEDVTFESRKCWTKSNVLVLIFQLENIFCPVLWLLLRDGHKIMLKTIIMTILGNTLIGQRFSSQNCLLFKLIVW